MRAPSPDDRTLALIAGLAALAGPRRTRPLAAFAYGCLLSRVHGAAHHRHEATLERLFTERTSAHRRIDAVEVRIGAWVRGFDELRRSADAALECLEDFEATREALDTIERRVDADLDRLDKRTADLEERVDALQHAHATMRRRVNRVEVR